MNEEEEFNRDDYPLKAVAIVQKACWQSLTEKC
jgi:hypothetical protein